MPVFSCAMVLMIVACGRDPVAKDARNTAELPAVNKPTSKPYGAPPAHAAPAAPGNSMSAPTVAIPTALQGRWALTPMDCTTTRGDAKGLLIVNADGLGFYESNAIPAADVAADPNSIQGDFTFTGEGQTWTKYEALRVSGRKLVRTESDPMASFNYAKCD